MTLKITREPEGQVEEQGWKQNGRGWFFKLSLMLGTVVFLVSTLVLLSSYVIHILFLPVGSSIYSSESLHTASGPKQLFDLRRPEHRELQTSHISLLRWSVILSLNALETNQLQIALTLTNAASDFEFPAMANITSKLDELQTELQRAAEDTRRVSPEFKELIHILKYETHDTVYTSISKVIARVEHIETLLGQCQTDGNALFGIIKEAKDILQLEKENNAYDEWVTASESSLLDILTYTKDALIEIRRLVLTLKGILQDVEDKYWEVGNSVGQGMTLN